MLDIETAIKHCLEVAERYDRVEDSHADDALKQECIQCATDHRQLAEWLTELKELRSIVEACNILAVDAFAVERLCKELKEAKRLLKAAIKDIGDMSRYCLGMCCDSCPQIHTLSRGYQSCIWQHEDEALKLIGETNDEP